MPLTGPRFTIRDLMIAVAVVAGLLSGLLALSRSPYGLLIALGLLYLTLCVVLWWMFRRFRRLSAFGFGVVATLTNLSCAAFCIFLRGVAAGVLIALAWFWAFPLLISVGAAWAATATRRDARPRRSPLWAWPLVLVPSLMPLTMMLTPWPLTLAFLASRPALERLADRVAAGEAISRPEWAGLFRVAGLDIEPANGNVGLITDPNPSGRAGFVRVGPGVQTNDPDEAVPPFRGLNVNEHLFGRWWYQEED
jgi:hypothetical protein